VAFQNPGISEPRIFKAWRNALSLARKYGFFREPVSTKKKVSEARWQRLQ
jgi:hypothetical protein